MIEASTDLEAQRTRMWQGVDPYEPAGTRDARELRQEIRAYMQMEGMTQNKAAAIVGCSRQWVSDVCREKVQ